MLSGCSAMRIVGGLFKAGSSAGTYESSQNYSKEMLEDKKEGIKYFKVTKSKDKIIPKLTFAQKIGKWVGGLTTLGIMLAIIGFVVAPTATMTILWAIARAGKAIARRAFTETATQINKTEVLNRDKQLHDALKDKTSPSTKKMVGELKAEL